MRSNLNLITLSLIAVSGSAIAADFSVKQANTGSIKTKSYQCKRCPEITPYQGSISLGVAYNNSDDIHVANAFNNEDGASSVLNADIAYLGETGYQAKVQVTNLGLENGNAHLEAGKTGLYQVELDYRQLSQYQADKAKSNLWYAGGTLTPDVQAQTQELSLKRKQVGMGLSAEQKFGEQDYQVFARYSQENKTGYQSASLVSPRPVNFGLPVDAKTDKLASGLSIGGQNWLTLLEYQYSEYDSQIDSLSLPYLDDVYAPAPDNSAHQLSLAGQYLFGRTVINGRLASGRMLQDAALIQMSSNPIKNWDGEVDTLDGKLALTSLLNNTLRLVASVDYAKRDNKSSVWEFAQFESDRLTGAFRQNVPLDTERMSYKLNLSYRINSDYRLQAGFDRKELERSVGDREQTDDNTLWTKLDIRSFDNSKLKLKASYAKRGGSEYQASSLTSTQSNPLLRKYYLADRDRTEFEAKFNHNPSDWFSVDITGHYAKDDYTESQLGLLGSEDYGYDINLGLSYDKQLSGYAFAGQQWIDSQQNGSQSFGVADWSTEINDEFIHIGAGMSYTGMMADALTLGADYLFANSESDNLVSYDIRTSLGDYYSYSHSLNLYANYRLSEQMALKLAYQYERYYDTDYAQVDVDTISGLITLGDLNHNYNAQQVMLSFNYTL